MHMRAPGCVYGPGITDLSAICTLVSVCCARSATTAAGEPAINASPQDDGPPLAKTAGDENKKLKDERRTPMSAHDIPHFFSYTICERSLPTDGGIKSRHRGKNRAYEYLRRAWVCSGGTLIVLSGPAETAFPTRCSGIRSSGILEGP